MFDNDPPGIQSYGLPSFANLDDIDSILAAEGALSMAADNAYTELLEETNAVLQQASHRFQELFQGLPVSCFCYDANGDIYEWNRECEKASGISAVAALQRPIWNVFCAPKYADQMKSMVDDVFKGANFEGIEIEAVRADGHAYPVLCSMFPLRGFDGNIVGGISANVNITERKLAEEELRKERELLEERVARRTSELATANEALALEVQERTLYADLVRNMQTAVYVYRLENDDDPFSLRLIATNPAATAATGVSADEIIGKLMCENFPNLADAGFPQIVTDVIRCGASKILPDMVYGDNRIVTSAFSVNVFPLPNRCAGVSFDNISERKRAEQELQRMHEENAQLLAAIGSIMIGVDCNQRIISWNAVAERAIGIKTKNAVGKQIDAIKIQWEWEKIAAGLVECQKSQQQTRLDDVRFLVTPGKNRFLGMTINPLKNQHGEITGFLIIGTDITERRLLEAQLAQAQKLESIGQLAAGIAHEINTPIQYVGDNTRFVLDAFGDLQKLIDTVGVVLAESDDSVSIGELRERIAAARKDADVEYLMAEVPKAIEQSLEGVQRVAHIVRAMKEFSHPGKEEKTGVDLNQALDSTITVARNEWKYVAEMVTDFAPDLPVVPCLPGDLNQVFLNMIVNAAHAIADVVGDASSGKGIIKISTSYTDDHVEVRISDSGTGIPPEAQGRIFDPFFTTKAIGKGTGQGLAISHNVVVDKHGGAIRFETEPGKGTTFIVQLPIAEGTGSR